MELWPQEADINGEAEDLPNLHLLMDGQVKAVRADPVYAEELFLNSDFRGINHVTHCQRANKAQ